MGSKAQVLLGGLTRWWGSKRVATAAALESTAWVLLSGKGEASGVALGSTCSPPHAELPFAEQRRFFEILATRFGPNLEVVRDAVADFLQAATRRPRRVCTSSPSRGGRS